MSEEQLEPTHQQLSPQSAPGAEYTMGNTEEVTANTVLLQVEKTSVMMDASLSAAEEALIGMSEVECSFHTDSGTLEQSVSSQRESDVTPMDPTPIRTGDDSCQAEKDSISCPICHIGFRMASDLKEHFKSHPPLPQDFRCWQSDCSFMALDFKKLHSHLRREHRLSPVTCSHRSCRLLFPSREEMSRHFRNHFPFHCNCCDFISANTKLFHQHQKTHAREGENQSTLPKSEAKRPSPDKTLTAGTEGGEGRLDIPPSNEPVSSDSASVPKRRKLRKTSPQYDENLGRNCGEEREGQPGVKKKVVRTKVISSADNNGKPFKGDVEKGKEHLFKTHICPECKRCFKKRTHLADHLRLHFPDPNLQCPNCRKFFTSRSKLKIHMMRESGEKAHRCPLCDYSSVEKNALNRHMASIHEGVSNFYSDTYSCPVCRESFKLSQALKDHMKSHKSEQNVLLCFEPGCDQALSDRKEFVRHLKEAHAIQAVECRYHACSLLFKSQEDMEQHRKNHFAFHCQECDFVCSNKHVFRRHKKHGHPGKEELVCGFCPYKSFNPVEYAEHVGKMHANEKIHRCAECDFATAHKRVLIRHMLLHTGEKPHKCSQCDFMCRDISYLSKHMLTHSTDKNYMCTECGYITKWKHYLNVHMRKHSGDLRYHCSQCSYRCHRADQLSSHKLRHQGKTLICEICGFGCRRKNELQKHMLGKHSQSSQTPMYQCRYCNYQTKYKQTLINHENGKHTKHREYRCALCSFRTFSNTSLFFHKRKSHGYVPGDKDWLERYANKQQEISQSDLLFPYKAGESASVKLSSGSIPVPKGKPAQELDDQINGHLGQQSSECLPVEVANVNVSVTEETLLAAITLEPAETCSIEMEDFPVRLELSSSNDLLAKGSSMDALVTCEGPLPTRGEILCFSQTLTVDDQVNGGQDFEEESDPPTEERDKLETEICITAVEYNQEKVLCELNDQCEEVPVDMTANLELRPGEIPVEVQGSWADVVKGGMQLTIVCESSGLNEHIQVDEVSSTSHEESCRPESILKALRKQDKEQAETLVLEGRVQMLVVQSNTQFYRCEKCSYITKKKSCIVQHTKSGCQTRKSSLVCEECGARFKQQRGLNTHVLKKCPVALKKKRACLKTAETADVTGQPMSGLSGVVSAEEDVHVSQEAHIPENCLETVDPLSNCQELVQEPFRESIPENILDSEEIEMANTGEHINADSAPVEKEKYRFEGGKFCCNLCSYSCSRECTMTSHVKENCLELSRVPCSLCPEILRSETALRRHQLEEHESFESSHGVDQISESSFGEESHNTEENPVENQNVNICNAGTKSPGAGRLLCPNCPFTCTQERAIKTHKKKGCLKPGEIQCPLCSFRCMSILALKRHRKLHRKYSQSQTSLQCKQCDFTCKQSRCMKQHVQIRHEGVKPYRCQHCDFSTTRRYRLEAHESLHTGVGRISCGSCSRTFGTNSKLRLHQRRVHEKKPTHFCKLCDYSGYSHNDIGRHMGSCHHGDQVFPCAVCEVGFSSEAALKQHSLRKHQEKAVHRCSRCSFSCYSQATLRCHTQKQHLQLDCSICKESFSCRKDMEEHRKSHFSHHCHQCQYAAKDRQQLVNHYSEEHESLTLPGKEGEEGPLRCPFCAFSCRHQLVYDHHVKGHGATQVYKCSDCEYSTRNKQKITWHSRIHTGEKPYKCHLCTYACADPSRLKYHMRIHKDEKNYLCPECGYKCKWVNQLKYHMTKHTGLKPYKCEECDYCTNRADALRVHRETRHRETRSFICEQCGKAFKTRFLLKTHLKKHSEEKPYVCNICQRGFRWPAGLRHHYLTHTNQQPFFCQHCSYRAKQKFQVVKHLQRHHPNHPDVTQGVGKEPYLFSVQGHESVFQPATECDETLSGSRN